MNSLFDNTVQLLTKAISFTNLRHNVIASNIANVDTPGYKAMDLKFEHLFKKAFKRGSATALSTAGRSLPEWKNSQPMLVLDTTQYSRLDGNTVNPDQQLAQLAENTIMYNSLVQLLNTKFKMLQTAISERR